MKKTALLLTVTALADPADGGSIRSTAPGIACPIDCSEFVLPGTTLRLPEPLTGPAGSRGPAPGSHPHRKDAS